MPIGSVRSDRARQMRQLQMHATYKGHFRQAGEWSSHRHVRDVEELYAYRDVWRSRAHVSGLIGRSPGPDHPKWG